jgi:hypothetical protein
VYVAQNFKGLKDVCWHDVGFRSPRLSKKLLTEFRRRSRSRRRSVKRTFLDSDAKQPERILSDCGLNPRSTPYSIPNCLLYLFRRLPIRLFSSTKPRGRFGDSRHAERHPPLLSTRGTTVYGCQDRPRGPSSLTVICILFNGTGRKTVTVHLPPGRGYWTYSELPTEI